MISNRSKKESSSRGRGIHSFCSFAEVERLIIENGGRIVGLEEPKLTHLVIDKREDSRRLELMKRTAKSVFLASFAVVSLILA